MDSGMRSISNYDSMPYTIVTSLEMSDEPHLNCVKTVSLKNMILNTLPFRALKPPLNRYHRALPWAISSLPLRGASRQAIRRTHVKYVNLQQMSMYAYMDLS